MAKTLADGLYDHGYMAVAVGSGEAAAERLRSDLFDAMVTDLRMPKVDGLDLLALSRRLAPERPVIMMTAYSALDTAVESIRQGAYHYLTKPFKVEELALFLRRALDELQLRCEAAALRKTLRDRFSVEPITGAHVFEGEIVPIRDLQRRYAVWAMTRLGGHKGRVAEKLGIDAKTLWKWLGEAGSPE
jgi:two-component system response regulator HydG